MGGSPYVSDALESGFDPLCSASDAKGAASDVLAPMRPVLDGKAGWFSNLNLTCGVPSSLNPLWVVFLLLFFIRARTPALCTPPTKPTLTLNHHRSSLHETYRRLASPARAVPASPLLVTLTALALSLRHSTLLAAAAGRSPA